MLLPALCGFSQSVEKLEQVLFTDVSTIAKGDSDKTLLEFVSELISKVETGEEIYICMFKLNDQNIIKSLIDAADRGVRINIILNKGETSEKENKETVKVLREEIKHLYYLSNTIGENSIIHNKFILFSEVEYAGTSYEHVIVQTSHNLTEKDTKKAQDLVLINDSETFYCYQDYWYDIKVLGNQKDLEKYTFKKCENESKLTKAYFYPKRKDGAAYGKDDIEKSLKNIQDPVNSEIYFLHAKWDKNRDNLLDELDQLQENGAKITVVANENIDKQIEEMLEDSDTRFIQIDSDDLAIHSKIILIGSSSNGETGYRVLTGSHNLTEKSLERNFEVLLEIRNQKLFTQYRDYIESIISLASN